MRGTHTWKLTRIGMLSAVSIVLYFIEFPVVAFYKLDLSTFPAIVAGFSMGPLSGVAVVLIKNLAHLLNTQTMGVGELADFLMSSAIVLPAALIYTFRKTRAGALRGLATGTFSIAVIGALTNYFVLLPFYSTVMHMPPEVILGMAQKVFPSIQSMLQLVLYITLPFNLFKGLVLSLLTFLIYKRISPLLHPRAR